MKKIPTLLSIVKTFLFLYSFVFTCGFSFCQTADAGSQLIDTTQLNPATIHVSTNSKIKYVYDYSLQRNYANATTNDMHFSPTNINDYNISTAYFGDSNVFTQITFNISSGLQRSGPGPFPYSVVYQYPSSGQTWMAFIPSYDSTSAYNSNYGGIVALNKSGSVGIPLSVQTTWSLITINGIPGYYVRQAINVYTDQSITLPYFDAISP